MAVDTNLTQMIENTGAVITSVSGTFTDVLSVFLQPPLIFFVGLTVFGIVLKMGSRMMRGRR